MACGGLDTVKFRGEDAYFLIHVENQASAQADFPRRMFRYFARINEHYDLPVYPVVIFSYETPLRPEPNEYAIAFPGRIVLKFTYRVIQLNRLPWRRFLKSNNPVASALMAKMKMRPQDRPKVRAECLRLLASLKLDPARSKIIGGFIESYLMLTAVEMKQFERVTAAFPPNDKEKTVAMISSWEQKGIIQGKEELIVLLIQQRFGPVTSDLTAKLSRLTSEELNDLGRALFDFTRLGDVEQWLAQR